ncbi:hypothetical protein [Hyalangium rubrum]|uniref:Uncharacterized protein n=1 Tax=Hyalangium rubrum TaxID=3103134 RepID=A0ABU5H068_9BACT|nr:hypothetical protein [Hyalangium sp. s54d21]MDY7226706.1 hypothetical protein [Hyalangium sp. s54d21]
MKLKALQKLFFALPLALYAVPAHATTWYTSANLDFTSIATVGHYSKYITSTPYFSIVGTAYGASSGIQGVYASQDQVVLQRCLALAEQVNLSRGTGSSPMLRIQVQPDPAHAGFAQIQYCSLHQ